jgi:type I restriction-modification system DNA methylase subunit
MVLYLCEICNVESKQKIHHDQHKQTEKHILKRDIMNLELDKQTSNNLLKKYELNRNEFIKGKFIIKKEIINYILDKKESTVKIIANNLSLNKYSLRQHIHEIHNFLRNNGAGYGMKPLNIFSLFYGLMRIEQYDMYALFNINEITKFNVLVEMAKNEEYHELENKIRDEDDGILTILFENDFTKSVLFYEIPSHIPGSVFGELIIKIDELKTIEIENNLQLIGKIYEYFIGRDDSAISELGAFFTDRPIPNYIFKHLIPIELNSVTNKIGSIIDPFGGSGGFIIDYINKINKKYPQLDWANNIENINHFDMNEDVVKLCSLEIMCLTKQTFNTTKKASINSFKEEFENKKYSLITSNPPYGGDDKNTSLVKPHEIIIKECKRRINDYPNSPDNEIYQTQIKSEKEYIKLLDDQYRKQIVSVENSSERIKEYSKKYNLEGNDKEVVSLILFMDLLEKDGICSVVLKQGVFFNSSINYKNIREHLITHFNVLKIIKIPEGSFENTNCVTSILFFKNNGPTTEIEFSDLTIGEAKETLFENDPNGFIRIKQNIGDIVDVSHNIIKTIKLEEILSNEDNCLDVCDYGNFKITPHSCSQLINSMELFEFKYYNDAYNTNLPLKNVKIGDIEKNRIIKSSNKIKKEDVGKGGWLKPEDILISCCRPNCDKTRLVTQDDIDKNYISYMHKIKIKDTMINDYPTIYIYSILYQFIGEKGTKKSISKKSYFERMFVKSTMYPTIKIGMLKLLDIPVHKNKVDIERWVQILSPLYTNNNMTEFKQKSRSLFDELIQEFTIKSL